MMGMGPIVSSEPTGSKEDNMSTYTLTNLVIEVFFTTLSDGKVKVMTCGIYDGYHNAQTLTVEDAREHYRSLVSEGFKRD